MGVHLTFNQTPSRPHQVRACPANFADVFIRGGWSAVRAEFGLNWRTERRCLEECGGEVLRRKRREYLAKLRKQRKSVQRRHEKPGAPLVVTAEVQAAIAFLRSREGGSWLITATGAGDFYFGATRKSGDEIVAFARRKGLGASLDLTSHRRSQGKP